MKNIRLTTPVQHDDENPNVELDQGTLEQWLDELSVSDTVETVRQLDEAVSAFNEVKVSASKRLKLLEVYFKAFQRLLQGCDEMRIAQLNISANQKKQLSNDIMWLYIKLSHGYKIIVKNEADRPQSTKQPQYLLLVTFRALELTVVSLIYAYRFAFDTPPLTYLELHQLYAFAEHSELLDKPVKAVSGYPKTPTIASFYALALVFVSIDPRQYESYTLEVLFLALQPFSFNCSITRTFEPNDESCICRINLNENRPSTMIANNELSSVSEWTRYLDIESLIAEINVWLDENKDNKNTLLIEEELELFPAVITRLKVLRNKESVLAAESNYEQVPDKSIKIIVGLSALESLLVMKAADLDLRLNYKTSEWSVHSESPADCELASNINAIDEELLLGDLVAIVTEEDDKPITLVDITYISSLQQFEQGALFARLEYLKGSAYPLTYIMIDGEREKTNSTQSNGIYFLDDENKEEAPLLVVNRAHYKESQQYMLKTRDKICKVVATRLVKQTMRYSFLNYEMLQEESNDVPGEESILNRAY